MITRHDLICEADVQMAPAQATTCRLDCVFIVNFQSEVCSAR